MAKEGRGASVDTASSPGRAIGRDIAAGEAVEHELDAFISRCHEHRRMSEPEREAEAAWKASERRQEAHRRRENAAAWHGWHVHRAELYARLSAEHEAAAEGLIKKPTRGERHEQAGATQGGPRARNREHPGQPRLQRGGEGAAQRPAQSSTISTLCPIR